MTSQLLMPKPEITSRKIWRRWKWIGLASFAAVLVFSRWLPGIVVFVGYLYGIVVIANLLFHGFRYLKDRLFWRVRNRLLGAFIFVGVIPLALLLGIVALSGYLLLGQMAGRYLEVTLNEVEHQVTAINAETAARLPAKPDSAALTALCARLSSDHAGQFSRISARLLRRNRSGGFDLVAASEPPMITGAADATPESSWLGTSPSFEGLIRRDRTISVVSLQPVAGAAGIYLGVSVPLDKTIEDRIAREKSIYFSVFNVGGTQVVIKNDTIEVTSNDEKGADRSKQLQAEATDFRMRRSQEQRRTVAWWLVLEGIQQESGKKEQIGLALLYVPFRVAYQQGMGQTEVPNRILVFLLYGLGGTFLAVELVSLIIGFTISRRITRSVHDMYQGILALQRGALDHQIPVRRQDQLGLLAHSFNHMTASITRLLEEVSEKKRLEQELEIAREVQATLFPKHLPRSKGMVVFGGCEPARVVSGDYYDFIVEDPARLDIVVADISGKGISAALLMANLQAAMRNQLLASKLDSPEAIGKPLADIMARLNEQIYANSPSEKYATLFLGRYDADEHRLWYCNAGHLPPVLLDGEQTRLLEPTGMVVGLLPNAQYEVGCVEMRPGALLAIFTDGVTETVNQDDEEFGDDRLISALKDARTENPERVYGSVIARIRAWQGNLPQHDDITLIIAKAN